MPSATVLRIIDHINNHDVPGMLGLMSDDHTFIDAHENAFSGIENMRSAWNGYFSWFPDYRIEVESVMANGDIIAVFGHAGGSYQGKGDGHNFRLPASWRATVMNGKIKTWQVYCDTKKVFDILTMS